MIQMQRWVQTDIESDLSNEVLKFVLITKLQKYQRSMLEVEKKSAGLASGVSAAVSNSAESAIF
jgi:hypothetical protein